MHVTKQFPPFLFFAIHRKVLVSTFFLFVFFTSLNAQNFGNAPTRKPTSTHKSSPINCTKYIQENEQLQASIKALQANEETLKARINNADEEKEKYIKEKVDLEKRISEYIAEQQMFYGEINKYKMLAGLDTNGNPRIENSTVKNFDKDLQLRVLVCFGLKQAQQVFVIFRVDNKTKHFPQELSMEKYYYMDQYKSRNEKEAWAYIKDDLGYTTGRARVDYDTRMLGLLFDLDRLSNPVRKVLMDNGVGGNIKALKNIPTGLDMDYGIDLGGYVIFARVFQGVSPLIKEIKSLKFGFATHNRGTKMYNYDTPFFSNVAEISNIPIIWLD